MKIVRTVCGLSAWQDDLPDPPLDTSTVTEDEFSQSLVGQAFTTYLAYLADLTNFLVHVRTTSGIVIGALNIIPMIKRDLTPIDGKQHDPVLHGLIIIGAWSALEAYVGDFCKAAMQEQPQILDTDAIKGIKVPISDLLANDSDKPARVLRAIESRFARGRGVGRFEDVLNHLGLGESVPEEIKRQVLVAQKIRNVWSHSAGKADDSFLEGGLFPQFQLGDKVAIDSDNANLNIAALMMYGIIVTNRWRLKLGLDPALAPDETPFKDVYDRIYSSSPGTRQEPAL